jgi:hypothetical protein
MKRAVHRENHARVQAHAVTYNGWMRWVGAWMLLVACGKAGTDAAPDAPRIDGAIADATTDAVADAPYDASTIAPVTVITYEMPSGSGVASDVPVVFVQPNGTIAGEVRSDLNGVASATVLPGASVTAVYRGAVGATLYTVTEVQPGDHIDIGPAPSQQVTSGTFTVNVPAYPGAMAYDVYGPCGGTFAGAAGNGAPTPATLTFADDCQKATMDLVVVALGPVSPIAYVDANNVPYTNGGQLDITESWQPLQTITASYANVPTGTKQPQFFSFVPDGAGWPSTGVSSGGGNMTVSAPVGVTSLFLTRIESLDGVSVQEVIDQNTGTPSSYSLDLGATLLPWLAKPVLDPAKGTITTAVTGNGSGDLFDVMVNYSRIVNNQTLKYEWTVFGPTPSDFTLPSLPLDLVDVAPHAGDQVSSSAYADFYDAEAVTGYDQVRGHLFGAFDVYLIGRGPSPGRIRQSQAAPPFMQRALQHR